MPHRVLLLEDESAIADNLIYALLNEGFVVQHVGLAREALSAFAQDGADVVVSTSGCPTAMGWMCIASCVSTTRWCPGDVFDGARRRDRPHHWPGAGRRRLCDQALFAARSVRSHSHHLAPQSGQCRTGPWRLDEAGQLVRYAGQALPLTRYEYLLLATLLRRPGRIFDRPALMDLVWSDASDTSERTVDAHIKLLRAKLRQARADPAVIQTHRHMGYSFQG